MKKKRSKSKAKVSFANAIITVCISVSTVITSAVLWEYHRLCTVIPSGVLGVLFGFWGGELLIVALRQIFGSDVPEKIRQSVTTTDGEGI